MEDKTRLEIKNPCQADWSKMSVAEAGRYCSNCEKTVLDFSALSKAEIIEKFSNSKTPLCIRALKTEIDQPVTSINDLVAYRGFGLAASLLLFGVVTSGFSSSMDHQLPGSDSFTNAEQRINDKSIAPNTPLADSNKVFIKGTITDSTSKLPLDYVSVYIKGTKIGWISDSSGYFTFEIPKEYQKKSFVLVCAYVGYHSKEITIEPDNLLKPQQIIMSETNFIIGEVDIKKAPGKKAWQFWK